MGGSLKYEELIDFKKSEIHKNIENFVETGTYKAESTIIASSIFKNVYTTEIHEGLYLESINKCTHMGINNISFFLGNSIDLLDDISKKVCKGAVFFIDAHISGTDSGWNGLNRVPIFEELNVILKHKIGPSVFIIDDLRLWKSQIWDWAHISNEKILKVFIDHGYTICNFFENDDRFYVYIK